MTRVLRRRYGHALRLIVLASGERLGSSAVLAGAYRGKALEDRSLLVHAAVLDSDGLVVRALCRRVPSDSLAGDDGDAVTCPECIRRMPAVRFP